MIKIGTATVEVIQEIIDMLPTADIPEFSELTLEEKTLMLKECTRIIANLNLNLSCYPTGYSTTILFDLDGNPI